MEQPEAVFSTRIVPQMMEMHRKIVALKYMFLKVTESPALAEAEKLAAKEELVRLAERLDRHYSDLRFRKISRFNIEETERIEREYLSQLDADVRRLERRLRRLSGVKVRADRLPVAEKEIDEVLLEGKIFEERALEKDRLDRLNSIPGFLQARMPAPRAPKAPAEERNEKAEQELRRLKMRAYEERLAGCESRNLDILFKVLGAVERALKEKRRIHVTDGELEPAHLLNHGEVYARDLGHGAFSLFCRERNFAFSLSILPVDASEYRGEISGWAESGINQVSFFLRDPSAPPTGTPEEILHSPVCSAFLSRAGVEEIHAALRRAAAERATRDSRLEERVEREMKEKVSRALDGFFD